eukprot:15095_1
MIRSPSLMQDPDRLAKTPLNPGAFVFRLCLWHRFCQIPSDTQLTAESPRASSQQRWLSSNARRRGLRLRWFGTVHISLLSCCAFVLVSQMSLRPCLVPKTSLRLQELEREFRTRPYACHWHPTDSFQSG